MRAALPRLLQRGTTRTLVLMRELLVSLVAAVHLLAAAPAYAHGEGSLIAPAAWGGLIVGAVVGAWFGYRQSHPGMGLGWGVGALFVGLVAWAGWEGELLAGALLYLFIVPFAGVIPLAIAFFVTYALAGIIRSRLDPEVAPNGLPTDEH